jgi:5'-deoxynucleotidase YfbR-like HD superfamily hydrolase
MTPQLHALLDGGFIERYHTKGQRMLTRQCVAEHSWRMAAVLFAIWPDARPQLIWATLFHDVSERVTGDVPSPVKRASPEVEKAIHDVSEAEERRIGIRFELTEEEGRLLAWLDRYEGALHCLDEIEMGNRKAIPTFHNYMRYITSPSYALADPEMERVRRGLQDQLAEAAVGFIN